MNEDDLRARIDELGRVNEQLAELEKRKAELVAPLRSSLVQRGAVPGASFTLLGREFACEMSMVKGRTTYDTAAATRDGLDLSAYQKTGAPSIRVSIKRTVIV